jgi:murein DD-endopeptidase MepM/ murein hydrolase activator NlpD
VVPVVLEAAGEFVRPGAGRLTSPFGRRWGRLHGGIDIAAGTGSPIRAVTKGTVIDAGTEGGYGKVIRIAHPDGIVSVYAHLSALQVKTGEKVSAGKQIGREGNTGQSTGPHLHFEIRINGTPVNPIPWLAKRGVRI